MPREEAFPSLGHISQQRIASMGYTFHFEIPFRNFPFLLAGVLWTLRISVLAIAFGMVIGVVAAVGRNAHNKILRAIAASYIEFIRNTPFLIQLYFIYFVLTSFGINLAATVAGTVGLAINSGAYIAEIVRAGIESIQKDTIEASYSLGIGRMQCLFYIILPIAIRKVAPPLSSQFIAIVLASSIVSVISAQELTWAASVLESRTYRSFEIYIVTAILYFIMAQVLSLTFTTINRKLLKI